MKQLVTKFGSPKVDDGGDTVMCLVTMYNDDNFITLLHVV